MDPRDFHERYAAALLYARTMHAGQTRRHAADVPYIVHPIRVAALCLQSAAEETPEVRAHLSVVALLHDTVEDTAATFEDVEARFGARVCEDVRFLSKPHGLPKVEGDRRMIEQLVGASRTARIVKLADRFDNLTDARETFHDAHLERYVRTSAEVLRVCGDTCRPLALALERLIAELT